MLRLVYDLETHWSLIKQHVLMPLDYNALAQLKFQQRLAVLSSRAAGRPDGADVQRQAQDHAIEPAGSHKGEPQRAISQ